MRTLISAPTQAPAARADPASAAAGRAVTSAPSAGGARPGLAALRAPPDAPIQRVTFARFTGRRRLWNWFNNDQEDRIEARERQARESVESLDAFAAHPVYGGQVQALRQRLAAHRGATVDTEQYAGHQAALDTLHRDSERLSYGISGAMARAQRQRDANNEADALHQETLEAHTALRLHGPNNARLDALDDIQRRHIALMTRVHQHDLDLPTPDRGTLSAAENFQIQSDWRRLNTPGDVFNIGPRAATPELMGEMRSMHARLLAGRNGRTLIRGLVQTTGRQPPLNIWRSQPDLASAAERRGRPAARLDIARREGELDVVRRNRQPFYDQEAARLKDAPREQRRALAEQEHAELGGPGDQLAEERRNAETPSPASASSNGDGVTVRQGLRDSELLNFGAAGAAAAQPRIAAPASIIYGHELIHVLRRRLNRPAGRDHIAGWSNAEERDTIEGEGAAGLTENLLRADYGLPDREHHTSVSREEAGF